ncbi:MULTISPECIES: hypothetical protein [unclassified Streptomyces]|uniref:hypothetical protein n=1 Tax=unclassified Streptomyces TaxID=2593676 RepID=UPI0016602B4B|nr:MULTISPECIES: hypothetical protein [unclassified Streptomyces]MBD0708804.1 hypothetical protein [Streptomyces sp. CBMA291]MBD0714742.1 hypothetical protein [Streptomyces sp. CBMA370]
MTTITAPERAATQAYLRLLASTRAVLTGPLLVPYAGLMPTRPMAEAHEALRAAGLDGNEDPARGPGSGARGQPPCSGAGRQR